MTSNSITVNFRQAGAAEADLLVTLMRELYAHERIEFAERVARKALAQLLADETLGRVWLIEVDDGAAGYVVLTYGFSLEFHGRDALIDELFINERWRGRGVGRRVLEFVAAHCRAAGIAAVHLAVEHENERAASVYRAAGFRAHARHVMTKWLDKED